MTAKRFYLGGLVIHSELHLTAPPAPPDLPIDVIIRLGPAPHTLLDATEIEPGCLANEGEYLHTLDGIAVFYLKGINEIVIEPLDQSRLGELRSFLHSVIFAVLFYRRGFLPLHASAVSVQGRVLAFMGPSGAGKSSLAAFMGRSGYQVITDDLCLLHATQDGTGVSAGAPWLKLWDDALDGLGISRNDLQPVAGKDSKYLLPWDSEPTAGDEILPLGGLFVLEQTANEAPAILPLSGVAAIAALIEHTYPGPLVHKLHDDARLFQRCAEVLKTVAVSTFRRPWDLARFPEAVDHLLAHIDDIELHPRINTSRSGHPK